MITARNHRTIGLLTLLAFIGTGVYLRLTTPWAHYENEVMRYLFRANHVYIAFSGAVNLALGLGLVAAATPVRRWVQVLGSALVLAAPAVLIAAFFYDPPRARPERLVTTLGVIMVVGGVVLHLLAATRRGG